MRYSATTAQRAQIDRLLKKCEIDTPTVSLIHRLPFEKAGIWSPIDNGQPLAQVLGNLTFRDASNLIAALKDQAGEA